jgi:hypothetical protein
MKMTSNTTSKNLYRYRHQSPPELPIIMDIAYLKPLAVWYSVMTESQKRDLPIRVLNALDSLYMVMKGRL